LQFPIKIDHSPKNSPYDFWSVVHLIRNIGVETPQVVNGLVYDFVSWSDHGGRLHNLAAPPTATEYVAHFWKRVGYGSITANPNPIIAIDGSGQGATTLSWSSAQTSRVEVRLGAPGGALIARSGSGTFSQVTGNGIRDGAKIFLQDVTNNQPLTSTYTLDSVTMHVTDGAQAANATSGSITASPNPFPIDRYGFGDTTVTWTSTGTTRVEVHINSPSGPLFAGGDPGTFSQATGHWVTQGMTFYLQDVSNGLPLTSNHTLATVRMRAVSPTPVGSIIADPNPFTPNAQGLGQTTLVWTSVGTTRVEVHVNSPNGNRFAATGAGTFSALTGPWLQNGMTFYLQNVSGGRPLTSDHTIGTVTVLASH
jgi:hypothetical protein